MRRWQNGKVIGHTRLALDFRQQFGTPYWVVHRAPFHQAMHALAIDLGVTVKLASMVISYNVETPSITFVDASIVSVDLVVAANTIWFLLDACFRIRLISPGVNLTARAVVLGGADIPPGVQDLPCIEL